MYGQLDNDNLKIQMSEQPSYEEVSSYEDRSRLQMVEEEPLKRNHGSLQASSWAPRHYVAMLALTLLLGLVIWLFAGRDKLCFAPASTEQPTPLPELATPLSDTTAKKVTPLSQTTSQQVTALADNTHKKATSLLDHSLDHSGKNPSSLDDTHKKASPLPDETANKTFPLSDFIPKRVWMYRSSLEPSPEVLKLRLYNHKFLTNNGFEITLINDTNYHDYLSRLTSLRLTQGFKQFQKFAESQLKDKKNAKTILDRVKIMEARIQALYVLEANGGVMLDQSLTLTEDLSWIDDIDINPYVNRLNRSYPTSVVGFLEHRSSSQRVKHPTSESLTAPFKLIREKPSLSPALIVARKNAEYLSQLCLQFDNALRTQKGRTELLKDMMEDYYGLFLNQLQFLRAAQRMNKDLVSKQKLEKGTLFVDTLGLSLINSVYGPDKRSNQFRLFRDPTAFKYEADISFKQLQEMFGPFRYGVYLRNGKEMQEVISGSRKVMNGSLLHHTHPGLCSSSLYPDSEVNTTNSSAPEWKSLPKIVWTIWLTGYESAYVICKVAFAIMKHRFQDHGYTINFVTKENAREFLDNETVTQLERITNNKKYQRYPPTLANLFRLALLIKHGGAYIDMSTLMLSGDDWIRNIARMPSHLFMNRFSELPKVLNTFNFKIPNPPFWQINSKTHTKQGLFQNYENNFIIAEKDNEYLKLVFDKYKELLETKPSQVDNYVNSLVPKNSKLIEGDHQYLLMMQTMMAILMQKQKQLDAAKDKQWINAAHYYGLWSLYSPYGPSKLWSQYNHIDDWDVEPNCYFYDYSTDYVDGIIGRPRVPFVKLIGIQSRAFEKVFKDFSHSDNFHPKSLLRTLMDDVGLQTVKKQDKVEVIKRET